MGFKFRQTVRNRIVKKHTKIYMKYFGYGEQDFIECEVCRRKCIDIHHIKYKSQGGKDEINNLIGLCRECHEEAHDGELTESDLKLSMYYNRR